MSVLDSVLGRLRQKRKKAFASDWTRYKETVLLPIAKGQDVDIEICEQFIELLGIDEQKLKDDVSKLQKRLTAKAQLEQAKQNAVRQRSMEAEVERLNREFAKIREEYSAKITPLATESRLLASQASEMDFENTLRNSVMDPELIDAIEQNLEARKALYPRIGFLDRQLNRNADDNMPTLKWKIDSIEEDIAKLSGQGTMRAISDALLQHVTGDRSSIEKKERLVELREKLEPLYAQRLECETELAELRRQLSDLDAENKRLSLLALEP